MVHNGGCRDSASLKAHGAERIAAQERGASSLPPPGVPALSGRTSLGIVLSLPCFVV